MTLSDLRLLSFRVRVKVKVKVRVRVRREDLSVNNPRIELGDGICDFEKVLPDQRCLRAKRD